MATITFLDKSDFSYMAPQLFEILYTNMHTIAPTELSRDREYAQWYGAVSNGLQASRRQIILIQKDHVLLGFLQYYTNDLILMIEELQILPVCQGRVNFLGKLYGFLLEQIPEDLQFVEAFVHRGNSRSIRLQQKLGMEIVDTLDGEQLYHLRGDFAAFRNWYLRRKQSGIDK